MRARHTIAPWLIWLSCGMLTADEQPLGEPEEIPLPALLVDGKPAQAHTQGLLVYEDRFFITARRDDVTPRRALLLSTRGGEPFTVWDITPEQPGLDHPGGFDSDGERLWIPVSHSRRDGATVVRAYSIEALSRSKEATPVKEFRVDDHIGAIAVSTRRRELYGANWDTLKVYVWNLDGELSRSFTRAEFLAGTPEWSSAVQDWKIHGDTLVAGGLDKEVGGGQPRSRAVVQVIDLSSRTLVQEHRLPQRPGIGDLTREGMAVHDGSIWFLPEDLDRDNRLFRVASALGRGPVEEDNAEEDESYWRNVSAGKHVPEFHFIVHREDWKTMHPARRRPQLGRRSGDDREGPRRPLGLDRGERPPPRRPGDAALDPDHGRRPGPPPMGDSVEYGYVKAAMEVDGRRLDGIGLRFKGNSSFRSSGDRPRKPFKVDTNRFTKGLRFRGRTKLNFSNAFKDPTYMKEKLGYEVYRAAGLATPEVGWARLRLTVDGLYDREPLGLYVIVEQVDEKFIERRFGAASRGSLLLKPERLHDWGYFGARLSAYDERYDIKEGRESTGLRRRLVEFLRLVELGTDEDFSREIDERLDLEGLAGYLAATALLSSLDSFAGTAHNYYMLVDAADARVKILPWDLNETFATFTLSYGPRSLIRWDIERPWATRRRILERLFSIESFKKLYLERVEHLLDTVFTERALFARIDELRALIEPHLAVDPFGRGVVGLVEGLDGPGTEPGIEPATARDEPRPFGPEFGRPDREAIGIKTFIKGRIESVKRQLAGTEDGERLEGRRRRFPFPPR